MDKTQNTLSRINGYREALDEKQKLIQTGDDFTSAKGAVARKINDLHPKRLSLILTKITRETASAKTFRFESLQGNLPPFQAGQYINLYVTIDGVETARPYAISSSPARLDYYEVTVREVVDGFVSPYILGKFKEGMGIHSSGPMGSFYHNPLFHGNNLVFLAGGSGVAPAMSMIRNIASKNTAIQFHLIYGSRVTDDIIFKDALAELENQHDFLTVSHVISEPSGNYQGKSGFIDGDLIRQLAAPLDDKMFYICGPEKMHVFCRVELGRASVAARKIRIEANGPPSAPQDLEGWDSDIDPQKIVCVNVKGKGSFNTIAGEPLLNALERNGYGVENACRSGECSLCRIKLLSGKVFYPQGTGLRRSDKKFGWIHSCVSYPLGDIEILI